MNATPPAEVRELAQSQASVTLPGHRARVIALIAVASGLILWATPPTALVAGILFALKAGLGFGGALSAWLLAAFDYVPNAVQTPHALLGIRLCATVFSAVPFILGLICLAAYPIGRELGATVQRELAERRAVLSAT